MSNFAKAALSPVDDALIYNHVDWGVDDKILLITSHNEFCRDKSAVPFIKIKNVLPLIPTFFL